MTVVVRAEHNFGCAIVSRNYVLSQVLTSLQTQIPAEAEVTDFQIAVLVEQDVAGFQVSMDDICRVKKLKRA